MAYHTYDKDMVMSIVKKCLDRLEGTMGSGFSIPLTYFVQELPTSANEVELLESIERIERHGNGRKKNIRVVR